MPVNNVVRMNTAHASREGFEALIANVRAVSNRIAILMDTKVRACGPLRECGADSLPDR